MNRKFLLVCEGPTDIEVINAMSKGLVNANGLSIEIVPLSPQRDETSGNYPPHGWTAVRDWCQSNRKKTEAEVAHLTPALRQIALRKNWINILSASSAAGLLIQIDTDIAEQISDLPKKFADSGLSRKDYTRSAIQHWLAEKSIKYPSIINLNSLMLLNNSILREMRPL
jgi:hypothetical protein